MKKFSIQLTTFFFTSILIIGTILWLSNKLIATKSNFKLTKPVNYIIVGDSHPECAYNDSLIDNFSNCAQSGESYFYTFFKIRKIVEDNKQIETVFLEYNNDQIRTEMDNWIWGQKYLGYKYIKYAPFMEGDDLCLLAAHNFKGVLGTQSLLLSRNFNSLLHHKYDLMKDNDLGGYQYLIRNKTDSLLADISKKNESAKTYENLSEINISYLEKTIKYCKKKNVKIVLLRSPTHPKDPELSNENKFKEIFKTKFPDVEFLDFKDFPLQNHEYADLGHLNYKGAKKFSVFFNDLLKNNLLQKEQKQIFINKEIENRKDLQ